jgi:hypothetical protein
MSTVSKGHQLGHDQHRMRIGRGNEEDYVSLDRKGHRKDDSHFSGETVDLLQHSIRSKRRRSQRLQISSLRADGTLQIFKCIICGMND